jgi:hypothetical protein
VKKADYISDRGMKTVKVLIYKNLNVIVDHNLEQALYGFAALTHIM